jgi:hypothetical protein
LHTEKFSGADLRRVVSNAQFSLQKIQAATQAQGVKGI